jgi:hypothetical protein
MKRRFDILFPLADDAAHREFCWRDEWNVPGQSAFMLLAKFQHLDALSCAALAMMVLRKPALASSKRNIDLRDARQFNLLRMMDLLRIPLSDVAAAFLPVSDLSQVSSDRTLRWCPRCAARGVHLTAFQFADSKTCPVHGCILRDRCAQCGRTIVAYRLQASLFRSPFSCAACGHAWSPALHFADDRALRLSARYRDELAQSLARGWFGRRDLNVNRVLLPFDRVRFAWLGSAPRRGSHTDEVDAFCHCVVRGSADARLYVSVSRSERRGVVRTTGHEPQSDMTSEFGANGEKTDDAIFAQAVACYKAIKRHFMHRIGGGHRTCVNTAARYLAWRLEGHTTEPFCPVAQAVLRWRSKWEGTAVPSHLLVRGEHGFLGILIWLSVLAPVGLPKWSRATDGWVVLHVFAHACLDSFSSYLNEAADPASDRGRYGCRSPRWTFPNVNG